MSNKAPISVLLFVVAISVGCERHAGASDEGERSRQAVAATLSPEPQSPVRGEAKIRSGPEFIEIDVRLRGLERETSYHGYLHRGTCEAGGPVQTALAVFERHRETGVSRTQLPSGMVAPRRSYFLQAYRPDGTPVACGSLPTGAFGPPEGG